MSHRFVSILCIFLLAAAGVTAPAAFAQKSGNSNVDVEHFEDWDVRCPKDPTNGGCEMTQLVKSPHNDKPILRVVMGYPPKIDTAAMIVILPLGTRLAPGVQLQVDNSEAHTFPFQICLQQGCRADFPVSDDLREKMRHGSKATVSLIDPRGKRMDLNVSLQGFTDADKRISR